MKIIFNLVLKDFILQKRVTSISVFYGLVIAFSSAVAGKSDSAFIINTFMNAFFIITMTYFSVLYAYGYDEKNKGYYVMNSLPIKKSSIATSKYISLMAYIGIYSITIVILSLMSKVIIKQPNIPYIYSIIIAFIVLSFIYSIYYPLYFKFGMETLKIYKIFMMLFMIIVPSSFFNKLKAMDREVVRSIMFWIRNNFNVLIIMVLLISLILLIFSWILSVKIYTYKDL